MPSAQDLVLITGGTGHLGFRVLVDALHAGYNVRAAVRSQEKANAILEAPSVNAFSPSSSQLSFVIVENILEDGAYDEAVKGVQYIIHVASPISAKTEDIPEEEFDSYFIQPALKGTLGILKSASKISGIKRIVITSSEVAIIPWKEFYQEESDVIFNDQWKTPLAKAPYANKFEAYAASKVGALLATQDFVKENNPGFDVINMMPSFIVGKNELVTKVEEITSGTNGAALGQVLGVKNPYPNPSTTVFVNDIAKLHVLALDPKIPGNQSFLANSEGINGTNWGDAIDIVAKHYPEAVAKGILPNNGSQPTKSTLIDVSRTESVFGMKFEPYEVQVKSVVGHYLDLVGKK
ncbi:hypothetical protein MMC11_002649 [Xylographa trunciseda]|nr:hypothetical protein [Xylographa trunciseda]